MYIEVSWVLAPLNTADAQSHLLGSQAWTDHLVRFPFMVVHTNMYINSQCGGTSQWFDEIPSSLLCMYIRMHINKYGLSLDKPSPICRADRMQ